MIKEELRRVIRQYQIALAEMLDATRKEAELREHIDRLIDSIKEEEEVK